MPAEAPARQARLPGATRDHDLPRRPTISFLLSLGPQGVDASDRCDDCQGKSIKSVKEVLEVVVPKGARHGDRIVFQGKADEAPDTIPGDIVFVLQQKEEHPVFKRVGDDLFAKVEITLTEALCGFTTYLTHLDGKVLDIKCAPGRVIKHGQYVAIDNEGMPKKSNPIFKGKLYVEFSVAFPEKLDAATVDALTRALPPAPVRSQPMGDDVEEVEFYPVDIERELKQRKADDMRQQRAAGEAYHSDDDEDDGMGSRVQCAQQ